MLRFVYHIVSFPSSTCLPAPLYLSSYLDHLEKSTQICLLAGVYRGFVPPRDFLVRPNESFLSLPLALEFLRLSCCPLRKFHYPLPRHFRPCGTFFKFLGRDLSTRSANN